MYPSSPQGVLDAEAQELPVAQAINDYWAPIQTWSTIALAISQNGLALSAGATTILVLLILYALYIDRKEKLGLLNLYRKLPTQDQLLIKAVANTQKQGNTTIEGIIAELQNLTSTTVDKAWLIEKLAEAQNAGLIKEAIANKNDEPIIQWKNQVPSKPSIYKRLHLNFQ